LLRHREKNLVPFSVSGIFECVVNDFEKLPPSLLRFCFTHRWWARVGILSLALASALLGVAAPVFQKIFIDQVLGTEDFAASKIGFEFLLRMGPVGAVLGAFTCGLLAQGLGLVGNYVCMKEGTALQRIFSEALYRKTLSIRTTSLGATTVGEVVSIYATDVAGGTAIIDQVLPMAVLILCNIIIGPIAVYLICGIPMWMTILLMAFVISMTMILAFRQSRYFARFKQLAAERTGIVNEWVQSIRLLRILGWVEDFEQKIFRKRIEETKNRVTMVTNGQFMNAFGSSINFIVNLTGVASLMYLSGRRVSPGELFAMLWIFGVFLQRAFRQIPWFFTFSFDSTTSLARLQKFLQRPSDAGDLEADGTPAAEAMAPIHVRGLNLNINQHQLLNNVDLDIEAGEFVAVVGEVGSGKSLFLLSLVGETNATFNEFSVGETNILSLSLHERRKFFSYVPQEGFVMSSSLRENVVFRYEAPPEVDSEVLHALDVAQFKMSEELQGPGLDTEIGERGVNLSGGQRQRVSLARAHSFHRPVILLDDCLSAVDVDTEKQLVRDLLNGAWRDRTRILVTHRLSVLNLVDRVLFMEGGSIVEQGKFAELLRTSPRVQEFVASLKRAEAGSPGSIEAESAEGGEDVESEALS
jgi:ATP-binding cassette, subfamily B, multidrug efflux pump